MSFKVGQTVKLLKIDSLYVSRVGDVGVITRVRDDTVGVYAHGEDRIWHKKYIKKVGDKDMSSVTKYYRVVKDHPLWEVGAVISNENDEDSFSSINELYDKFDDMDSWTEGAKLVEQSDWFERVYPIGKLEKMIFGNKAAARDAAARTYKAK